MSRAIRNRKAQTFELMLFAIAVFALAAPVIFVLKSQNTVTRAIAIEDYDSSHKLLLESMVRLPACLGSGSTGVIDWSKVENLEDDCVTKGKYIWRVRVDDFEDEEPPVTKGSECVATLAPKRDAAVNIQRNQAVHGGRVELFMGDRDFVIQVERDGTTAYVMTIFNIGDCEATYDYEVRVMNAETGMDAPSATTKVIINGNEGVIVPGTTSPIAKNGNQQIRIGLKDRNRQYALRITMSVQGTPFQRVLEADI